MSRKNPFALNLPLQTTCYSFKHCAKLGRNFKHWLTLKPAIVRNWNLAASSKTNTEKKDGLPPFTVGYKHLF